MFKTIGKYEILRLLGKGSMGEVYLGLDPLLGREVAIKTIQSSSAFDGEGEVRFTREARAMAALNHPHIITLFDFGSVGDRHFLAMEYLDGSDLSVLIQDGAHTKLQLLEALAQACEGLGYAHSCGIVHRDVKPGNILVTTKGNRLLAKLLDFGVASVDRSNLTEQGVWMGTVSYMAPEYLDTGKATATSDLFAIGAIIYEILSGGRKPFPGESTTAILTAILRKPAEPLSGNDLAGVPPEVIAVMDRALAKDPAKRYRNAEELASALRAALTCPLRAGLEEARQPIVVGKGGGATCLSLRVAVRQAQPGTVIILLPGTYKEAVRVDKALTFQGEGDPAAIVLESPTGPCLTVAASGCTVSGFTLQGKDEGPAVDLHAGPTALKNCALSGLRLAPGVRASLKDCTVTGSGPLPAVLVETGATLDAAGTTLTSPAGLGLRLAPGAQFLGEDLRLEDSPWGAAELGPGSSAHLIRCSLLRSRFAGILAYEGAQAQLEDCLLSGHEGAGLHAMAGARVQLSACRILGNEGMGLSIVDGGKALLEDCDITANGQPGVLLHRGGSAHLSQCRLVDGHSLGIACHQDGELVLDHCLIRGNALGGLLLGPGAGDPDLTKGNQLEDSILR